MWPITPAARLALRTSHTIAIRASAYTTVGTMPDLPITGGSVDADAKSQVRRSGQVTIGDPGLWPIAPEAALSPVGSELGVEYGIVVPGVGTEWVPVIRGPIQKVTSRLPATAALQVSVADRSARVAQDRLDAPTQTTSGALYVAEIQRLITESYPQAEVVDQTGDTRTAPSLQIDTERWAEGIERLADAIAAEVYADAAGRYVIRPQPTLDDPPVWVVDAGDTGVLIAVDRELTRERVYNAVVARGERLDGTAPVFAKVVDDDPASPTFYGGPFGKRVRYYASPLLTTVQQCEDTARALLARARGYMATVQVEQVTNPALEPGDVIEIVLPDGSTARHIIDGLPIGLAPGSQKLNTRTVDALPGESVASGG